MFHELTMLHLLLELRPFDQCPAVANWAFVMASPLVTYLSSLSSQSSHCPKIRWTLFPNQSMPVVLVILIIFKDMYYVDQ